jgi:hypothetical protein
MAKFSTTRIDPLHDEYWRIVERAAFRMPDRTSDTLKTTRKNRLGTSEEHDTITDRCIRLCKRFGITYHLDNLYVLQERKLWGLADQIKREIWVAPVIGSPVLPKKHKLHPLPVDLQAYAFAHEIAHVLMAPQNYAPKVCEFEADMVAYLFCYQYGVIHEDHIISYLTMRRFFRTGRSLREVARWHMGRVLGTFRTMEKASDSSMGVSQVA